MLFEPIQSNNLLLEQSVYINTYTHTVFELIKISPNC